MNFHILIDRSSIRVNPDAGRTEYTLIGNKDVTLNMCTEEFIGMKELNLFSKEFEHSVILFSIPTGNRQSFSFAVNPESDPKDAEEEITAYFQSKGITFSNVTVECKTQHSRICSMRPEPKYKFSYIPTQVICDNCEAVFDVEDLETDIVPDGEGGDLLIENICPHCRNSDCVTLTRERIEDIPTEELEDLLK